MAISAEDTLLNQRHGHRLLSIRPNQELRLRRLRVWHKAKLGAGIKFSAVEFTAAIQTGDRSFNSAHSRKLLSTARAFIKEATRAPLNGKWQGMSSRLIANSQVLARFPPFGSVRSDTAAAGSELCEQMSQLVPQGAVDLRCVMLVQARIQRNEFAAKICAPRGTEKPRIPFHMHRARQFCRAQRLQHLLRFLLKFEITAEHDERRACRKSQVELLKQLHTLQLLRSILRRSSDSSLAR